MHVCGACKAEFSDVEIFVDHKKTCSKRRKPNLISQSINASVEADQAEETALEAISNEILKSDVTAESNVPNHNLNADNCSFDNVDSVGETEVHQFEETQLFKYSVEEEESAVSATELVNSFDANEMLHGQDVSAKYEIGEMLRLHHSRD